MNLFLKENLWSVFNYPTIRSNITTFDGIAFICLVGFGMMYLSYYVMDNGADKVYKNFTDPLNMITV